MGAVVPRSARADFNTSKPAAALPAAATSSSSSKPIARSPLAPLSVNAPSLSFVDEDMPDAAPLEPKPAAL